MRVVCGLLVVSCLLLVSCARTVTKIVTYGSEMVVEVELRGTMEANSNRYFMVLSSNSNYKFSLPSPDNIINGVPYEFIEPETTPYTGCGSAEGYYSNYYSSWSGYIYVGPEGYILVKGPFAQGQTATRESISSLGEVSSTVKFSFRLEKIFGSTIPDTIYFNFVSVDWPTDSAKFAKDYLSTTNPYISKVQYSTVTISDEEDSTLNPALDVLSCKVTIQ